MTSSTPVREVHVVGGGALTPLVERALRAVAATAPAACVVARVPARAPLAELTDTRLDREVGGAFDEVLTAVQGELAHLRPGGRLVFVLPSAPLMAVVDGAAASAVTNGVLSMARTASIELARDGVAVNVVAVDVVAVDVVPGPEVSAALSAQLGAFLGPGGEQITGQEVYLTGGSDLGRLRP
jgi:NAD(P)-dependent dehydrogenase (short-subunit alcohol dehydrogenase family)